MLKKTILENQQKIRDLNLIERDFDIEEILSIFGLNKIIALIGPRRAGKTFLTFQIIKNLIEKKIIKLEQVIYLDFAGFIEQDITFEKVLEDYYILFPDLKPIFIFDEIQELPNFPSKLISLLNLEYKIIATGSNAHLLSKDLSTILRGKVYTKEIFPLNFKEFLKFQNIDFAANEVALKISKYKRAFIDYLKWGGFPELALTQNELIKENILKTYLDVMIYKDLQDRYNIKNELALKFLIKRVLFSYTKELNINKIYNDLKSQNIKISKDYLYNFYEYLENIYFIDSIINYWAQIKGVKKSYLIDISFGNIVSKEDLGKRFENVIFWELKKKFTEIFFLSKNYEIDFYLPSENTYIQVVYSLDNENYERETNNLLKQNGKKIVIFFEKTDNIKLDSDIEFINYIDWLLN